MFKKAFWISLILVLITGLGVSSLSFAQSSSTSNTETLTIVTYYPSPFGVYNELRAKKMAIGGTYYNAATVSIPGSADLIVEGNVGIGTTGPGEKLEVNGNGRITGNLNSGSINTSQLNVNKICLNGDCITSWPASGGSGGGGSSGCIDGQIMLSDNPNCWYECVHGSWVFQCHCFPVGTKVLMADATTKNIEDVKIGDWVLSYDYKTKKNIPGQVYAIESHLREHMCQIDFSDNRHLQLTKEHPIYTDNGWKSIDPDALYREVPKPSFNFTGKLKVGEKVLFSDFKYRTIKNISCWDKEIQIYDLKISSPSHTFYANGVLVRNY